MDLTWLVIFGLATWRVASMLVRETGPFGMFLWIRERAGITHDDLSHPLQIPDNFLAGILSCTWCCSMWVGAIWLILFLLAPPLTQQIATVFAFSTAAIIVDRWIAG